MNHCPVRLRVTTTAENAQRSVATCLQDPFANDSDVCPPISLANSGFVAMNCELALESVPRAGGGGLTLRRNRNFMGPATHNRQSNELLIMLKHAPAI
ncbi:hypothetical protein SAMN06265222_12127 [Neorhodopirellula lusitana]|uniref:Uncharacterized protein n=1 Tax=Neorhodopirellula lusitana TaxID=445327 RepID=A0ABY1QQT5_9BACT|nr:hypothetical protein SAMN06265222_12127 [Neorhodopirellula lusitana]